MGKDTKIAWTHHTANPWWGCAKVSPGCDHCYAEKLAERFGFEVWGTDKPRRLFGDKHWREPLAWNRAAERAGERCRVMCGSMCDVFERSTWSDDGGNVHLDIVRARLFELIKQTPWLDWLLITKRPENIAAMLPRDWDKGYPNAWLIATVENQAMADKRIPELLSVPARVHGLSIEPMLGAVDLRKWLMCEWRASKPIEPRTGTIGGKPMPAARLHPRVNWVIVGGESGPEARPMNPNWVRALRDQCVEAGVSCFFKQWGRWRPIPGESEQMFQAPDLQHELPKLDGRTWAQVPLVRES